LGGGFALRKKSLFVLSTFYTIILVVVVDVVLYPGRRNSHTYAYNTTNYRTSRHQGTNKGSRLYILTTTLNYSKVIVVAVAGVFPQLSQLVEKTQQKIKLKKSAWRWLLVNGNEIE
jgi:hypothetical protein